MRKQLATLFDAFRTAFDSLVRTYSPSLIASIVGFLAASNIAVTPELKTFIGLAVAFVFFVLWYLINRLYEVITGRVSKLLTLGLVRTKPVTYSPLSKQELYADEQAAASRKQVARSKPLD